MPDVVDFSATWAARIKADPLASQVIETLWGSRERYASPVLQRAGEEGPALATVIEEDFDRTRAHVLEHFRALLALPADRASELGEDPLAFVRRHGVRRAQANVPLQAVLQGYRTGHKSFWMAMCEIIRRLAPDPQAAFNAAVVLSNYTIDYTDLISVVLTDAYIEEEAKLAEERTRLSLQVVEQLLAGDAPSQEPGWGLCTRLGLTDGRPLAVVVVRSEAPGDAAMTGRALSLLARGVERILPLERFGRIVGVHGDAVVAVATATERPAAAVTDALRRASAHLLDEAGPFRIGVGLDAASIGELPRSHREAATALALGRDDERVTSLAEARVDDYLRHTADDTARRLAPPLPPALLDGELGRTLDAFAAANLNVKACARTLGVHNNTIYHRLNQVRRLTGVDPRTFAGLSALVTARALAGEAP